MHIPDIYTFYVESLLLVSWRPNSTTDLRLKQYQLIPYPRLSSDGRLSILIADLREPHGESIGDGQVLSLARLRRGMGS